MNLPTIILDPGHGGSDSGALGPSGLKESDVNLAVSLKLAKKLEPYPVTVVLTRDDDSTMSLGARVSLANKVKGKKRFFISIHCNSAKNPAYGIETFCARQTKSGYPFAENVHESLIDVFDETPDRGVKRANFTVLKKTQMPAVLAELEFIHTVKGEDILRNEINQDWYAAALSRGILRELGITPALKVKDPAEPVACDAVELADIVRQHAIELIAASGRYTS